MRNKIERWILKLENNKEMIQIQIGVFIILTMIFSLLYLLLIK